METGTHSQGAVAARTQASLLPPKPRSARLHLGKTTSAACHSSHGHVLVWKPEPRQSCTVLNYLRSYACLLTSTHLLRIIDDICSKEKKKQQYKTKTKYHALSSEKKLHAIIVSSSGLHCTSGRYEQCPGSHPRDPGHTVTCPLAYPFADVARQQERAYDYEKGADQEQHGGKGDGLVRDLRRTFFKLEEREKQK